MEVDIFAENLPGNVDNIRESPRGTYWVALSRARHAEFPSVLDTFGQNPEIRKRLITVKNMKEICIIRTEDMIYVIFIVSYILSLNLYHTLLQVEQYGSGLRAI